MDEPKKRRRRRKKPATPDPNGAPLHMTKIAFGAKSWEDLAGWYAIDQDVKRLTTRNRPTRYKEMEGGSLYWILNHSLVARSEILGFTETDEGRWHINLKPELVRVHQQRKRAHQGWRYLTDENAPADLAEGEDAGDVLPGKMAAKLERLGLI